MFNQHGALGVQEGGAVVELAHLCLEKHVISVPDHCSVVISLAPRCSLILSNTF